MNDVPGSLDVDAIRERLACLGLWPGGHVSPASGVAVRRLPSWVSEFGSVKAGEVTYVYLAPRPDAPTASGLEQAVLDVPAGRYAVATADAARGAWVASESAAAPPLVIGVPRGDGPLVIRLRRIA